MSTPHAAYRWWYRDPVTKILFKGTFDKIGVKNLRWRNYAGVERLTDEQRQRMLQNTRQHFARLVGSASGTQRRQTGVAVS